MVSRRPASFTLAISKPAQISLPETVSFLFFFFFFLFLSFFLFMATDTEVPGLGVESELLLRPTLQPQQHWRLNPLSEIRD